MPTDFDFAVNPFGAVICAHAYEAFRFSKARDVTPTLSPMPAPIFPRTDLIIPKRRPMGADRMPHPHRHV